MAVAPNWWDGTYDGTRQKHFVIFKLSIPQCEVGIMETSRLEAFSDGVIAITPPVLDIRVPHSGAGLVRELLNLWPSCVA